MNAAERKRGRHDTAILGYELRHDRAVETDDLRIQRMGQKALAQTRPQTGGPSRSLSVCRERLFISGRPGLSPRETRMQRAQARQDEIDRARDADRVAGAGRLGKDDVWPNGGQQRVHDEPATDTKGTREPSGRAAVAEHQHSIRRRA